jgi:geranylgeranyl reductase family protein
VDPFAHKMNYPVRRRVTSNRHDVIIVGAGPAGSVVAFELARKGINVLLLDRAQFPRDKVCGDYVEPRGLRILQHLGVLEDIEKSRPLPITRSATYIESVCWYRGRIPFYGKHPNLLPHGYIIPRAELDYSILNRAVEVGVKALQGASVTNVVLGSKGVEVSVKMAEGKTETFRARLVVGADGTNSIIARRAGLLSSNDRHIAISQRGYAACLPSDVGEASFFFDEDLFPGYGWLFPMKGGKANIGVGILAEAQSRYRINVPVLFRNFFDKLKRTAERFRNLRLCGPPTGGIVKTYGGAQRNHFDGGLLLGDAGSFVDPMTGEGITPAMESALLAAPVLSRALEKGRFDTRFLSAYETAFRDYFDPSMLFQEYCACLLRNRSLRRSWLNAAIWGCRQAQHDTKFARTAGACFGGIQLRPLAIMSQVSSSLLSEFLDTFPHSLFAPVGTKNSGRMDASALLDWQTDLLASFLTDPMWHMQWMTDVQASWLRAVASFAKPDLRYTICGLDAA